MTVASVAAGLIAPVRDVPLDKGSTAGVLWHRPVSAPARAQYPTTSMNPFCCACACMLSHPSSSPSSEWGGWLGLILGELYARKTITTHFGLASKRMSVATCGKWVVMMEAAGQRHLPGCCTSHCPSALVHITLCRPEHFCTATLTERRQVVLKAAQVENDFVYSN